MRTIDGRWIDWDEALRLFREERRTFSEIARRFAVAPTTVAEGLSARGARRALPILRGMRDLDLYRVWFRARSKCHVEDHPSYPRFGGQGIRMSRRWRESFNAFRAWALASGYRSGLRLVRKRRDRDFTPANCEWVTPLEEVGRRPRERKPQGKRKPPAAIDWQEAIRLFDERGFAPDAIAARFGALPKTIQDGLRRRGFERARPPGPTSTFAGRRLKQTWYSLHRRCSRPSDSIYAYYGARGARVGREWKAYEPFLEWSVAAGWKRGLCLVRIDRRKPYGPRNCEWVPRREMLRRFRRHRGPQAARRPVTAFGETKGISAWEADPRCRVTDRTIANRLRAGMDPESAITEPPAGPGAKGGRRLVRAFGETKPIGTWARDPRCAVSDAALRNRIASGMAPEEAITLPPQVPAGAAPQHFLTALGTSKSLSDWARDRRCAVTDHGLRMRILQGWSPADAIRTPPREEPLSLRLARRARRRSRRKA